MNKINLELNQGFYLLIDKLHGKLDFLNGRVFLINTLGHYSLEETKEEIHRILKIKERILEAKTKKEIICAIRSVPEELISEHLRAVLIKELYKK